MFVDQLLYNICKQLNYPTNRGCEIADVFKREYICNYAQFQQLTPADFLHLSTKYQLEKDILESLGQIIISLRLTATSTIEEIFEVFAVYIEGNLYAPSDHFDPLISELKSNQILNGSHFYNLKKEQLIKLNVPLGIANTIKFLLHFSSSLKELSQIEEEEEYFTLNHGESSTDLASELDSIDSSELIVCNNNNNQKSNNDLSAIVSSFAQPFNVDDRRYAAHIWVKCFAASKTKYFVYSMKNVISKKIHLGGEEEYSIVKNVPINTTLTLTLYSKSVLSESKIGSVDVPITDSYLNAEEYQTLYIAQDQNHTEFRLKVKLEEMKYFPVLPTIGMFNGITASIHSSTLVGSITKELLKPFNCYEIKLHYIPEVFGNVKQYWNRDYHNAKQIFGKGAICQMVRQTIRMQHQSLYREGIFRTNVTTLNTAKQFFDLLDHSSVFTYVITNSSFNFSETSPSFVKDMMSKHASHSNCKSWVRYSGEFHIGTRDTPDGALEKVLVMDNNSGTYSPKSRYLYLLQTLFMVNFPDIKIEVYDYADPALKLSLEKMKSSSS